MRYRQKADRSLGSCLRFLSGNGYNRDGVGGFVVSVWRVGFLFALTVFSLQAQTGLLEPERRELLDRVINGQLPGDPLKCSVQTFHPFLDFAFRYEVGYLARCDLAQFEGRDMAVASYLRIRPQGAQSVYLTDVLRMPKMPEAMRAHYSWNKLKQDVEFSGVFAAGVGEYVVDMVLVDENQRVYHKDWTVKISPGRSERKAELSVAPGTVISAGLPPWRGSKAVGQGPGPQLTVLLDAAPVYPASRKLRAWDRAFLMGSLASLLRGMQPSSVRLIAFNLEQQREVYREDRFDRDHFAKLGEALSRLELGTVSYKTLADQFGWANLLTQLVGKEARGADAADAVVFLGPNVRNLTKIPREYVQCDNLGGRLHYLEFFPIPGYEFPDTIHQLTNACHGIVYKVHSPAEFAEAIAKMQNKVPGDRQP